MNDLHTLAGRGPFRATTEFVNRRIFSELALGPDDRFVDVGCGNGFLLGLAQENVSTPLLASTPRTKKSNLCALSVLTS